MRILVLVIILTVHSCNHFGSKRYPAGQTQKTFYKQPQIEFVLTLKDLKSAFNELAQTSNLIENLDHFDWNKERGEFQLQMTVNFDQDELLLGLQKPEIFNSAQAQKIDLAFKFEDQKTMALRKKFALKLSSFRINQIDYLNESAYLSYFFESLLLNSTLTDYIALENSNQSIRKHKFNLVQELFVTNSIILNPQSKTLLLNPNLRKLKDVGSSNKAKNFKIWSMAPVASASGFKVFIGEGTPHEDWINQLREPNGLTLLEAHKKLYQEFSNAKSIIEKARVLLAKELGPQLEKIKTHNEKQIILSEIASLLATLEKQAGKILNKRNEHFLSSPEQEYMHFSRYVNGKVRYQSSELKRKIFLLTLNKIDGPEKTPVISKFISEELLSSALTKQFKLKTQKNLVFKSAFIKLKPNQNSIILGGELNLNQKSIVSEIESYLAPNGKKLLHSSPQATLAFKLELETQMADKGLLTFRMKQLNLKDINNKKRIKIIKNNFKTQPFLLDLTKKFLALEGQKLAELISYNELTEKFELKIDPALAFDKNLQNQSHLQFWELAPVTTRAPASNFLELTVGLGLRSSSFLHKNFKKNGLLNQQTQEQLTYQLQNEKRMADILITLQTPVLIKSANLMLERIVSLNNMDIKKRAKRNPGSPFHKIKSLNIESTNKGSIKLSIDIDRAQKIRHWYTFWKQDLELDSYNLSGEIKIESYDLASTLKLTPYNFKITKGQPSLVKRAVLELSNQEKHVFNDALIAKLLKGAIQKYQQQEFEEYFKLAIRDDKILVLLNPKAMGAGFEVDFIGEVDKKHKAIIIDTKQVSFAFEAKPES